MRKLYNYQLVRYFPNVNSDEFFNVGIHLANDEKNLLHFINDTHLTKIMSFPSIDKKNIVSFIEMLQKEKNLSHWYGNNLKFSEVKKFRSSQPFEEVLEILYEDYIGYKFHIKEKINTIDLIKRNTREIVSKEFKKYLDVNENTIFDFDIVDKGTNKHHYSNIGSLTNRENIQSMEWNVISFLLNNNNPNGVFEFLNISKANKNIEIANNILHKNNIHEVSYYEEDAQYEYLRNIANIN